MVYRRSVALLIKRIAALLGNTRRIKNEAIRFERPGTIVGCRPRAESASATTSAGGIVGGPLRGVARR